MRTSNEIEQDLIGVISVLQETTERDPWKAAAGRAAFLDQAKEIAASLPAPVSNRPNRRHNQWKRFLQIFSMPQKKEQSPMFSTVSTIILIVSLVLGGGGVTVAAAQQSLPDQALYPVKTWSEEVRLQLAEKEQAQIKLALEFAERRAEEMQVMLKHGQVPPQAVQARWQAEIDKALQLAAGQPDDAMAGTLKQIREQLQQQDHAFAQLGPQVNPNEEAVLAQIREQLRQSLHDCEQGLEDPAQLREQLRLREQNNEPNGEPQPENNFGPGPNEDAGYGPGSNNEPGDGVGPGDGTGYGPGDGICDGDCDGSNESYGPGPNEDAGFGPGDGTGEGVGPGDGTGYGPGDGTCDGDCDGSRSGYRGGDTGGDNSGTGTPGSSDTGSDNSGSGNTGGDQSGSGNTGGDNSGSGDNGSGNGGGGGGH